MAQKKQQLQSPPFLERYRSLFVFLFAVLLYVNTIPNGFNLDDELVTTTDEQYPHRLTAQGISAIPAIFSEPYYKDASGYAYDYRPVVLSTFAIERSITGGNVHISHFINAGLYGLLCLVLLTTLTLLLSNYNPLLPLLATLLFTAFPLHTEVVASLKNRDEILALLFALLSLQLAHKSVTQKTTLYLTAALGLFLLALLSKQTIISFAVIIPILLVLLTPASIVIPVVFAGVATLCYLPISPLSTLSSSVLFLGFMVALVVGVYAIHRYKDIRFPTFNTPGVVETASGQHTAFAFIELKWPVVLGITVFLSALSGFLYLYNKPFYFLPAAPVLLLPYVSTSRVRPYVFALTVLLGIGASLALWPNDALVAAFMIYLLLATFYFRGVYYTVLPLVFVVGLAVLHGWEALHVLAVMAVLSTVIWLPKKNIAGFVVASLVVVSNLLALISNKSQFVKEELYSLDVINVLLVLAFSTLVMVRRYLWLPAACSIIIMLAMFNKQGSFVDVSSKVQAIANKEIPQVIEATKIERPIYVAEAVTTPKSPVSEKLGTAAQVFRKYFRLTVLPYPMAFYYGYKEIEPQSVFTFANLLTLLVFAALLITALVVSRRQPLFSAALLLYLIGIGIYSNYLMPVPGMMADRFLFAPSLGFVLLVAWGLLRYTALLERSKTDWHWPHWPMALKGPIGGLLLGYTALTVVRNSQWENHLTLFSADINHVSNSAQANNLYAVQLMKYAYNETDAAKQQQMRATAELHFKKAVEIFPPFFNAWYDLARTQNILGKNAEAETNFIKAARLNPAFATSWLSAGELALMRKQPAIARSYYLQAMDTIKNDPAFYIQLSFTYFLEAKYDSANSVNKEGIRLFPQKVDFPSNLAQTFGVMNQPDSALYYYNKALQLDPSNKAIQEAVARIKASTK